MNKGVAPVVATIMLMGVATIGVGAIYTFTQGKIDSLTTSEPPKSSIIMEKSSFHSSNPSGAELAPVCSGTGASNEDYITWIILKHRGGEEIKWSNLKIKFQDKTQVRGCTWKPTKSGEFEPGEKIRFVEDDSSSKCEFWADLAGEACLYPSNVNYQRGYNEDEISVQLIHKPTDEVITTLSGVLN